MKFEFNMPKIKNIAKEKITMTDLIRYAQMAKIASKTKQHIECSDGITAQMTQMANQNN